MKLLVNDVELDVSIVDFREGRIQITAERTCTEDLDITPPCLFQLYGDDGIFIAEGDFPYSETISVRPFDGKTATLTVILPLRVTGRVSADS